MESDGGQSAAWADRNSTFTGLNDSTALERQCPWPSCEIPISGVRATVEGWGLSRRGLHWASGLSDYCLKTGDEERADKSFSPSLQMEESEEPIISSHRISVSLPPRLPFNFSDLFEILPGRSRTEHCCSLPLKWLWVRRVVRSMDVYRTTPLNSTVMVLYIGVSFTNAHTQLYTNE